MMQLAIYSLLVTVAWAYPGYSEFHHGPILHSAPIIPAPTYIKTYSAPIYSSPIIKAPIYAPAPIYKSIAPIPVVKHVVPATSYSTVTRYIAHPAPIVKTIVASPPIYKSYAVASPPIYKSYAVASPPIYKSYAVAAPLSLHGYSGYHH